MIVTIDAGNTFTKWKKFDQDKTESGRFHNIEGWQHKIKPGPSLTKISSKVSKSFFKTWVWY